MITQSEFRQSQRRLNARSAAQPVDRNSDRRNILFVLAAAALTFVLASYVAYRRFSPEHLTFASGATLYGDLTYRDPAVQVLLRPFDRSPHFAASSKF